MNATTASGSVKPKSMMKKPRKMPSGSKLKLQSEKGRLQRRSRGQRRQPEQQKS